MISSDSMSLSYASAGSMPERDSLWLATLARDTQNVKIGQMVTCNGYRNPALNRSRAALARVRAPAQPRDHEEH